MHRCSEVISPKPPFPETERVSQQAPNILDHWCKHIEYNQVIHIGKIAMHIKPKIIAELSNNKEN
jgi:hypothetical protein